eukprot:6136478-Prorocentrum_lima.AAC.1
MSSLTVDIRGRPYQDAVFRIFEKDPDKKCRDRKCKKLSITDMGLCGEHIVAFGKDMISRHLQQYVDNNCVGGAQMDVLLEDGVDGAKRAVIRLSEMDDDKED